VSAFRLQKLKNRTAAPEISVRQLFCRETTGSAGGTEKLKL